MAAGSIVIDLLLKTGAFETDTKRAEKRLQQLSKEAKRAGAVLGTAIVAGATAVTVAIKSSIDAMDDLAKSALRANVTTDQLSRLAYAGNLADVSMDELTTSLGKLAKSQDDAGRGVKSQADAFDLLGLKVKNADGSLRDTHELFLDFADAFQDNQGRPEAMAAGMQIFGRSFQNLIPLLKDGREGLQAAGDEAERFGQVVDGDTTQQAERFNDNLSRITSLATGLSNSLATELLPDLNRLAEDFLQSATEGDKLSKTADDIAGAVRGLISLFDTLSTKSDDVGGSFRAMSRTLSAWSDEVGKAFDALGRGDFEEFTKRQQQAGAYFRGAVKAGFTDGDAFGNVRTSIGYGPGSAPKLEGISTRAEAANVAALKRYLDPPELPSGTERIRERTAAQKALTEAEKAAKEEAENLAAIEEVWAQASVDRHNKVVDAWEEDQKAAAEYQKAITRQLDDMAFEAALLGMSNKERERAIALRYANADAASEEGQKIIAAADALMHAREQSEQLEIVGDGFKGLFTDIASGAKSLGDAFEDAIDRMLARSLDLLADQAWDAMLDAFKGNGASSNGSAGAGGSWWSSLLGAFGFAGGGYTGLGGKYQPAGIVHAGEYVLTADATKRLGTRFLDALNKGAAPGNALGGLTNEQGPEIRHNATGKLSALPAFRRPQICPR